jgi:translation initiation factor 2B subunit (eIF-2B alpha/beta/delta family)
MKEDIECIYDEVIRQAHEHINSKDIVLTFSQSDLLDSFLTAAYNGVEEDGEQNEGSKGKDFEVLVCETAPFFTGHATASNL